MRTWIILGLLWCVLSVILTPLIARCMNVSGDRS
jgi:hypothetical protein